MMEKKEFIALAGNIGSGKTTVAKLLSRHFHWELFDEPVIDNRFLTRYYGDMERWSFTLQLEFLIKRVLHHELIEQVPKSCIQDRSLLEDPEIFAKYLHGLGKMTDDELELYFEYFERLNRNVRQPDLIIYLRCDDVQTLMDRIYRRGRKEELGMDPEFLEGLAGYYHALPQILKRKWGVRVLTVDVTDFNVHDPDESRAFIAQVESFLRGPSPRSTQKRSLHLVS